MRISVKHGDEWQREHAKGFARWYAEKYLSKIKGICLRIHILPYDDFPMIGECENTEEEISSPKKFLIRLGVTDKITKRDFIMALAHEMVHLKQYSCNELKDIIARRVTMFKRKPYSFDMDYWEMPWEIEAFGMERGLLHRYSAHAGFYDDVVKTEYD